MLDVFVDVDDFVDGVLVVSDREVYVDSGASFVELRDAEAYEHVFSVLAVGFAGFVDSFLHILAQILDVGPWAGCFEALGNLAESEAEVTNVGNHVRQLIPLDTVLSTARNSMVLLGNGEHLLHLHFNFLSLTLKEARGCAHLVFFEAHYLEEELLLNLINNLLALAFFCWLDGLSKLELYVVQESKGRRINGLLRHFFHELHAEFEVRENDRAILLHLRSRSDSNNAVSDDSEVAFVSHDRLIEIWAGRHSRPRLLLLKCAFWRHERDALNDVVNIPIRILLHATGACRHPSAECRKLTAIWLMACNKSTQFEVAVQVLAPDASLDAGGHVVFVDPDYFVQSAHVQADDHAILLALLSIDEIECLGHIRATAIWY